MSKEKAMASIDKVIALPDRQRDTTTAAARRRQYVQMA